ncbi:MAG: LON peptidase substrate-binding domain-containing protein [Candidatus Actinomarina sp.]|nr:LON peptidase substrate-binding domain-containing protein [Candidatus Actinomarina sp.]
MIVEIPLFGAGINYFPTEISVLRVFEPRYLLLIGDSIKNDTTFSVGKNLSETGQIVSEVKIIDHKDLSNAEQIVVVECTGLIKTLDLLSENEYPKALCERVSDIGLPPTEEELIKLQKDITKGIGKMVEQGLDIDLPVFEIDTSNRILKLWELSSKIPMSDDLRSKIIYENDVLKRYEILKSYVNKINELEF